MARNLTETASFDTPITVPENGEPGVRETSDPPLQALANRTKYLKESLWDASTGEVILRDAAGDPVVAAGVRWFTVQEAFLDNENLWTHTIDARVTKPTADNELLRWGISSALSRHASITAVHVGLKPGAARSPGDRMEVALRRLNWGSPFGSAPSLTNTLIDSEEDAGTTAIQWVTLDLSGSPAALADGHSWVVQVQAGNDAGTNHDAVYVCAVEYTIDRLAVD